MSIDRRALQVLLAVLGIEQRELADRMGYERQYVANVLNGFTKVSRPFRRAFGEAVAELVLGTEKLRTDIYPAGPLVEILLRRAEQASNRRDFFADLGLNCHGLKERKTFSASEVDRLCCELGLHPSSLYPETQDLEEIA
jgi:transcriptional regulator with XRE-family HTH domain